MFSPRPRWVAKRGSVASSGRPIASHRRTNTLSALAATTTSAPSPVGYTFDGATPGSTLPERVRVDAAQLEVGHRRLHQRGDRLVDRDVDLLALAGVAGSHQRGQRADHREHRRQRVAEARCPPGTADGRGCPSCSGCRPSPRRRCRSRPGRRADRSARSRSRARARPSGCGPPARRRTGPTCRAGRAGSSRARRRTAPPGAPRPGGPAPGAGRARSTACCGRCSATRGCRRRG